MENNKTQFNIFLQDSLKNPISFAVERMNKFQNSKFKIQNSKFNNDSFIEVFSSDCCVKDIFKLGASICYSVCNWNIKILGKIKERSSINLYTGLPIFSGTEDEKIRLDKEDNDKLLDISDNFLNHFVNHIKSFNSIHNQFINDKIVFEIDLNIPDHINVDTQNYNNEFQTKFNIVQIELIDQLYFATIEVSEIDLIDIFCFGFRIQLNEIFRSEKSKQS